MGTQTEAVLPQTVIRRCIEDDWRGVRLLHIKLALEFPVVVDVELNDVLAAPDGSWRDFVHTCASAADQALFLAEVEAAPVGMGHVRVRGTQARLGMLYVDGSVRRHGIGAALIGAQGDWAHGAGASDLLCHIPDVSAGGRLAEALGWHRTEEVFTTEHGLTERKWTSREQSDQR